MNKKIEISKIVLKDAQKVNAKKVSELKESISKIGLLQPIGLNSNNELIFGRHRLEACKQLGWREIDFVRVSSQGEILDELASIDENLIRRELSHIQKAEMIARRKEIFDLLNINTSPSPEAAPKSRKGGRPRKRDEKFVEEITKLGINENYLENSMVIAERLTPATKEAIVDTPLAYNLTALLELARLSAHKQKTLVPLILEGKIRDALDVRRYGQTNAQAFQALKHNPCYYEVIVFRPPFLYMKYVDIALLELRAADNAVLFIFAEEFNLTQCLSLINTFGFSYKRTFVLKKEPADDIPVQSCLQFVLMATRGMPAIGAAPERSNFFENENSFYDLLEKITPSEAKKVEFFPPPHLSVRIDWDSVTIGMLTQDPEKIEVEIVKTNEDDTL